MVKVNLKDLYPKAYKTDTYVELSTEAWEEIRAIERRNATFERMKYLHRAHYSLDCNDGIENETIIHPITPEEAVEQKQERERIYAAVKALRPIQSRRIYAHFYLGLTTKEIAQIEGVDYRRVWVSIQRGLKKLSVLLADCDR